jgi:hypothetical protein
MKLSDTEHTSRPWRIHEVAPDFKLEDVWALPTPGGRREDFPLLVESFAAGDPAQSSSAVVRGLFALRWKLGELLRLDDGGSGVGSRVPSLRKRLAADLRSSPGPEFASLPFRSLYLTEDEWAAEIANRTMHGILHLGWVPDGAGGYRGQMAVLVKNNGRFGDAYMAAIRPFRHLLVYPQMLRDIERQWAVSRLSV